MFSDDTFILCVFWLIYNFDLVMYRLGHREQKDEWIPRLVGVFQRHNVLPPTAVVSAGSVSSACTAGMCCGTRNCLMKSLAHYYLHYF